MHLKKFHFHISSKNYKGSKFLLVDVLKLFFSGGRLIGCTFSEYGALGLVVHLEVPTLTHFI